MAPKSNEQQLAKDLYFNTDKTQQEIADILNVSRRTVYLWIKNGKWEQMKNAARQAPGLILQDIYNHIEAVNHNIRSRDPGDRCPTMEEVDKLKKLVGITRGFDKKHGGFYVQAYEELIRFTARKDHALSQSITKMADRYVKGTFGDARACWEAAIVDNVREVEKNLAADGDAVEESASVPSVPPVCEELRDAPVLADNTGAKDTPAIGDRGVATPSCAADVIMCDNDGITPDSLSCASEPATVDDAAPIAPHGDGIAYPMEKITEKETMPDPATAAYYATIPPCQRPSPFREGNIIWVNHIDDVNEDELKMGDSIRHYPDMDRAGQFNRAAYEMRLKIEEQDRAEKEQQRLQRKAANAAIVTAQHYYDYREILKIRSTDINDTIIVDGRKRNKMAFQYNLLQLRLPQDEQHMLTDEEFLRQRSLVATLTYMQREYNIDKRL